MANGTGRLFLYFSFVFFFFFFFFLVYFSLFPPFQFLISLHLGQGRQVLKHSLGINGSTLDNANQGLEGRVRGIAQALVHPALASGDDDTRLGAQPVEGDDDLCPVAAAHAVGNDVGGVAGVAQVQGRLGDADVRLDADEGDARGGLEGGGQLGHHHGELCLVDLLGGDEAGQGGHRGAELGGRLGGCVDGDGGCLGKGEQLLCRGYA